MKTYIQFCFYLALFLVAVPLASQAQTLYYDYDTSGNRKERSIHLENKSMVNDSSNAVIEDKTFADKVIRIYPNPTRGMLEVEIPIDSEKQEDIDITVTNITGQVIVKRRREPNITTIDLSNQPAGIYLMIIRKGKEISQWKIIKQ